MKKICFLNIVFCTILLFLFSQKAYSYDFERFILQNGLEVYCIQDNNSPSSSVYYINRAGFSKQNPQNAGFFQLYSNLFWSTNPDFHNNKKSFMLSEIKNICMQDQSLYSFSTPSRFLKDSLEMLKNQLENPIFEDKTIELEYSKMKSDIKAKEKESEFFINGAIDWKVFSDTPWKRPGGINPSAFCSLKIEQVRSILFSIRKNFYTPQNSALIITCPYTKNEILELTKTIFENWKNTGISYTQDLNTINFSNQTQKKFVIVTDAISTEFNQIVLQYASKAFFEYAQNMASAQMAAAIFEKNSSRFKKNLCNEKKLGILGEEYINTKFLSQGENSRIIIQSLLNGNSANPVEQYKIFIKNINSSKNFDFEEANAAKRSFEAQTRLSGDSAKFFANFIAYNWAYNNDHTENSLEKLSFLIDESKIQHVFSIDPYVFMLVNPETYEKYKKDFSKNHWQAITQKNAFWYKNTTLTNQNTNSGTEKKISDNLPDCAEISSRIIENIEKNSFSFELENKIPVFCSLNPQSSTSTILLQFEGGESSYDKKKRGMETILLKSLARTIEEQIFKAYNTGAIIDTGSVDAYSRIYKGQIVISCTSQDFYSVLQCINTAFIFGKISPYMEDELIYLERAKWRFMNNTLDFQLKCKALSAFYKGTEIENLFNCNQDILQNITFSEIKKLYNQNLNADRIGIVVTGNPNLDKVQLKELFNKSLGMLKSLDFEKPEQAEISFAELTQVSRLKRIFGSDVKAENAGPRPEHLIPTTEFKDPAVVFISCPKRKSQEYANFILALNCIVQSINNDFELQGKKRIAQSAKIIEIAELDQIIGIQFDQIIAIKALYKYFAQKCFSFGKTNLLQNQKGQKQIEDGKTFFESYIFLELQNSESCAKKIALNYCSEVSALYHIELYKNIQKLNIEDLQESYEKWLAVPKMYWIFSADSKQ
ncbi:MAG: hypothetical protein ACTTHG_07990 [Treponemataceae bacterium]